MHPSWKPVAAKLESRCVEYLTDVGEELLRLNLITKLLSVPPLETIFYNAKTY